jgi:hypothetical protein
MEKGTNKSRILLVFILAIVLTVVLYVQFQGNPFASRRVASAGKLPEKVVSTSSLPDATEKIVSDVGAKWKPPAPVTLLARDPMSLDINETKIFVEAPTKEVNTVEGAVVKVEESGPTFVVSGIVYNKDAPSSVVVDGRLLHEADTVLGLTIERIGEDEVIFVKDGKRWILKVGQKSR